MAPSTFLALAIFITRTVIFIWISIIICVITRFIFRIFRFILFNSVPSIPAIDMMLLGQAVSLIYETSRISRLISNLISCSSSINILTLKRSKRVIKITKTQMQIKISRDHGDFSTKWIWMLNFRWHKIHIR